MPAGGGMRVTGWMGQWQRGRGLNQGGGLAA